MKVSAIASILLGVLPCIVSAATLPVERSDLLDEKHAVNHGSWAPSYPPHGIHERTAGGIVGEPLFRREDDDDWLLVLYTDENSSGTQCGGPYERQAGGSSACLRIPSNKWCAEVKVNTGVCDFNFKSESCQGEMQKTVSLKAGKDANGVTLSSKVNFVSFSCK